LGLASKTKPNQTPFFATREQEKGGFFWVPLDPPLQTNTKRETEKERERGREVRVTWQRRHPGESATGTPCWSSHAATTMIEREGGGSSNLLLATGTTKASETAVVEPSSGNDLKPHEQQ